MSEPTWLKNAVIYEIYPQTFLDTNGDGIGDLPGIIQKLDYIRSLNVNAIWLNPCFVSPFQDAGYDIADYFKVAPRYGTNEDMKRLLAEAHKRKMHVLLDLVAGHTSLKHPWFEDSQKDPGGPFGNYYIWTNGWRAPLGQYSFIRGYGDRDGYFMSNYFYCQPALNYGFCPPDPQFPWQISMAHPDAGKVREAMRGVMKFWLDMGCDGFRVDMAASLIRGENASAGLRELWHDYRTWIEKEYPDAVLVAEWSNPSEAIDAGFHVDFMAHSGESGYTKLLRAEPERIGNSSFAGGHSFFDREGKGDADPFLRQFRKHLRHIEGRGYIGLITGNHDIGRLRGGRPIEDVKLALAFMFLLPGIPFIYAGDEIGMNNVFGLGNKEGSYNRSVCRTPIQWDDSESAGFSSAPREKFYLPLDPAKDRPDVASQEKDPDSLLNFTRKILALRQTCPAVGNGGSFRVLFSEPETYPVVYERRSADSGILVAVNPSGKTVKAGFELADPERCRAELVGGTVRLAYRDGLAEMEMSPASYAVYRC